MKNIFLTIFLLSVCSCDDWKPPKKIIIYHDPSGNDLCWVITKDIQEIEIENNILVFYYKDNKMEIPKNYILITTRSGYGYRSTLKDLGIKEPEVCHHD